MNRKIVIPIFLLLFVGIVYLLAWSSAFTVSTLEIVGVSDTQSQQSIKSASGIYIGEKLARVEPRASSAQISRPHWIKKSRVSRNWRTSCCVIVLPPCAMPCLRKLTKSDLSDPTMLTPEWR